MLRLSFVGGGARAGRLETTVICTENAHGVEVDHAGQSTVLDKAVSALSRFSMIVHGGGHLHKRRMEPVSEWPTIHAE
jgi:hypothetical protein